MVRHRGDRDLLEDVVVEVVLDPLGEDLLFGERHGGFFELNGFLELLEVDGEVLVGRFRTPPLHASSDRCALEAIL